MKSRLELGKCYLELGKLQEAEGALSKAVEIDPHSTEPRVLLVQVYARLKDEDKRKSELATIDKLEREEKDKLQGAVEKAAQKDK